MILGQSHTWLSLRYAGTANSLTHCPTIPAKTPLLAVHLDTHDRDSAPMEQSSSLSTPVCTFSSGMKPCIHVEEASMITVRSCSGPLLIRTEYREGSSLEVVSSTVKFWSNTSATTRWSMASVSMLTVPVFHSRLGTTVTTGRPPLSPSKWPSREADELLSA